MMAGGSERHHGGSESPQHARALGREDAGTTPEEALEHSNTNVAGRAASLSLKGSVRAADGGESCWKARDTFALLSFLALTLNFMVRSCLSITIVAMVSRNDTTNGSQLPDTCPLPDDYSHDAVIGEFDWSDGTVSVILGSFYCGYMVTGVVGGRATEYFGGRITLGLGVLTSSILTILSPLCINVSEYLFIALRVLMGMIQGTVFPAVFHMMATWIPPKDKAKYASMIIAGVQVGTVIGIFMGGWLSTTSFLGGWPSVYYVFGGLGVVWVVPWFLLAHDLPEVHPRISPAELEYILTHRHYVKRDKVMAIPWRGIATSVPFWAILGADFCFFYSFYTLLTELPTYLNNIFHFDLSTNAVGSALPFILQGTISVCWGRFADFLSRKNMMTITGIRKLSTGIAVYSSAVSLVALRWVNCNSTVAVVVLCLAVGLQGSGTSGLSLAEQDIAPNLTGTLKGLTNTLASVIGFITPAVAGAIVHDNQTVSAWNTVFLIAATFNFFFGTLYLIFGTADVQPWNEPKPKKVSITVISELSFDGHKGKEQSAAAAATTTHM